ncbi:MAG: hypothetical protein ACQERS_09835 [Bacteroidota bacterium]
MKLYIILYASIIISLISCEREDELNWPYWSIYKTQSEYFNYMTAWVNKSGEVIGYPYYTDNDTRIFIDDNDTIYTLRVMLSNNYCLSWEVALNYPFTDITFKEFYRKQFSDSPINKTIIESRIIDRDPFIEYYEVDPEYVLSLTDSFRDQGYSDSEITYKAINAIAEEINIIIEQGQLQDHFNRLK